jgi:hypothetical protein
LISLIGTYLLILLQQGKKFVFLWVKVGVYDEKVGVYDEKVGVYGEKVVVYDEKDGVYDEKDAFYYGN